MNKWIYNRDKGHVEENGKYICDPRSDLHGEQIAREHNACLCTAKEVWQDVTEECALTYGIPVHQINGRAIYIMGLKQSLLDGYRLRKVRLSAIETAPHPSHDRLVRDVFLVERKVQP